MRHFLKVGDFDPTQTLVALAQQPELWNAESIRTTYPDSPHAAVDDILLWFNTIPAEWQLSLAQANAIKDGIVDDLETYPQAAWTALPQVRTVVFDLMRRVEGVRLGRVMITRLPPGKSITPHADQGAPATYFERYQLALQSLPGCTFRARDEIITMRSGECWWFDNSVEHEVINASADDRLALIVDVRRG